MGAAPAKEEVGTGAYKKQTPPQVAPAKAPALAKKSAQKNKKNDKKSTKIHPQKAVLKPTKKKKEEKLSPEDIEIIEHLEFLMMLGLLQDFDLFEQEGKPK